MALAMSRPWKHPKSGMYWLRKAVPDDLRRVIGKREEKRSLRTRDPAEAKRLHAQALADLEVRWQNLRTGSQTLSEREAHDLAAGVYERWLEFHRDNPGEQRFWQTDLFERLWAPPPPLDLKGSMSDFLLSELDPSSLKAKELERWCITQADGMLSEKGILADEGGRLKMAKALASAVQRASRVLEALSRGEALDGYGGIQHGPGSASIRQADDGKRRSVSFDDLFQGWAVEKSPAEKTQYEWRRVLNELARFLGHNDAARVSADDLIAWKTAEIEAGRRPKTIRDAKLAPVRAIFQWAVDNRRLPSNPAERIVMDVKAKAAEAKRSFTDEEAAVILSAALREESPVRRWVPWLCAYSGARVAEVSQLRAEDIVQLEGTWCAKFDPSAGPLKTRGSERAVPIHPAVIAAGFLAFVQKIGSGPLFPDLPPDRFGSRGGNGTKVVGRWVRSLGLKDPRLSPSHSWRHRFKTLARRYELATDIANAITGHSRKTVADSYGEYPITALDRELRKIPAVKLG